MVNKRAVREYVKSLRSDISFEKTYWPALEEEIKRLVRKHVYILRGHKRLNHHHVTGASFCSSPPDGWNGNEECKQPRRGQKETARCRRPDARGSLNSKTEG